MAALIRCGALCKACSDTQCRSEGSEQEPIEINCPSCEGEGCSHCNDGAVAITECPNRYCREMSSVTTLADMMEKGIMPVAGGALDQSAWFLQAARILERDEAKIRSERNNDN